MGGVTIVTTPEARPPEGRTDGKAAGGVSDNGLAVIIAFVLTGLGVLVNARPLTNLLSLGGLLFAFAVWYLLARGGIALFHRLFPGR